MIDNSQIEIDGKKYDVIDVIFDQHTKYVFLSNVDNEDDFFVKKEITKENGKNYLVALENEEEVLKAMQLFQEKHQ